MQIAMSRLLMGLLILPLGCEINIGNRSNVQLNQSFGLRHINQDPNISDPNSIQQSPIEVEPEGYKISKSIIDNMPVIVGDPNSYFIITIPVDPNAYFIKILP